MRTTGTGFVVLSHIRTTALVIYYMRLLFSVPLRSHNEINDADQSRQTLPNAPGTFAMTLNVGLVGLLT